MARVLKREAAKRDLIAAWVWYAEMAGIEVSRPPRQNIPFHPKRTQPDALRQRAESPDGSDSLPSGINRTQRYFESRLKQVETEETQ